MAVASGAEIDREYAQDSRAQPAPPDAIAAYGPCRLSMIWPAHPAIIDRIAGLLGPDIVVWTTNFWLKEPGGAEIPWHQDINFWPIEPPVNVSAWIAIDEVSGGECLCTNHPRFAPTIPPAPAVRRMKWQSAEMVDPHVL